MARTPVLAAGGILVRSGSQPLIAIVQRRKDNCWVLPKGKLKPRESVLAAAKREVVEETGHSVIVHEFLGTMTYEAGGRPKIVKFWRMQPKEAPPRKLMRDVKAVEWLPPETAIRKLSLPHERLFLTEVASDAVTLLAAPANTTALAKVEAPAPSKQRSRVRTSHPPAVTARTKVVAPSTHHAPLQLPHRLLHWLQRITPLGMRRD